MIKAGYIILLTAASIEDARYHKVNRWYSILIFLAGCIQTGITKEGRWVSLALTCICFLVLYLLYRFADFWAVRSGRDIKFGGADVRLIPGMMLVQGWDQALTGILLGLLAALVWVCITKRWKEEIPLVPWMSAGGAMVMLFL